ncbi:MAG: TerC family protein [Acholeplasmataceae bacterium]|nr:TerC family protein [Acholeplasmataceae bacterium]
MEFLSVDFLLAVGSIIILDLVLGGDNAVVIALASRDLPQTIRKKAIYVGTAGALAVRLLMTFLAVWLLTVPFLQAIGGLALIPIAIKLLKPTEDETEISSCENFWTAIKTIIVADVAMGIDNVLAVAGAAEGHFGLVVIGLLVSVPIIVWGSQLIGALMQKYPSFIFVGAGILGWTAGSMIIHDKIIGRYIANTMAGFEYIVPILVAGSVLAIGYRAQQAVEISEDI